MNLVVVLLVTILLSMSQFAFGGQAKSSVEKRINALQTKYAKDLGSLVTEIQTEGDTTLTVIVTDIWYDLKPHEKERIMEYLKLSWGRRASNTDSHAEKYT